MNTVSTYREILNAVSESFSGSETPFLDACLLLAHSLGLSRESLLARLPEQQRMAMILRTHHEFSYDEIAAQMSCSPGKVKTLIFRARQSLKEMLTDYL